MSESNSKFTLTEDWTVVVFGFLLIALALLGGKTALNFLKKY